MKTLLYCLTLSFFFSCSLDNDTYNDQMDGMYECHENANYDSTAVYDALVGTYDWQYVRVPMISSQSNEDYQGWIFILNNDGSFELNQNDTNTVVGNWQIEKSWASFQIKTQPSIESVWGEILICDPYLMFLSSPVDGPDHLYEKR